MLKKNPGGYTVLKRELDFTQRAYWEGHDKRRVDHAVLEILLKVDYSIRLWDRVLVFWSGVRRETAKGSACMGEEWFFSVTVWKSKLRWILPISRQITMKK